MVRKTVAMVCAFLLLGVLSGALFFRVGGGAAGRAASPARAETSAPASPPAETPPPTGTAAQQGQREQPPPAASPTVPAAPENTAQQTSPPAPASEAEEDPRETEAYTWEDIEAMKNAVKPEDQLTVAALVFLKLSAQDIQYLYSIAKDGLTEQEQASAKELFEARFTPEELAQIYGLYAKYAD